MRNNTSCTEFRLTACTDDIFKRGVTASNRASFREVSQHHPRGSSWASSGCMDCSRIGTDGLFGGRERRQVNGFYWDGVGVPGERCCPTGLRGFTVWTFPGIASLSRQCRLFSACKHIRAALEIC